MGCYAPAGALEDFGGGLCLTRSEPDRQVMRLSPIVYRRAYVNARRPSPRLLYSKKETAEAPVPAEPECSIVFPLAS